VEASPQIPAGALPWTTLGDFRPPEGPDPLKPVPQPQKSSYAPGHRFRFRASFVYASVLHALIIAAVH